MVVNFVAQASRSMRVAEGEKIFFSPNFFASNAKNPL